MRFLALLCVVLTLTIGCSSKSPTTITITEKSEAEKKKEQEEYEKKMKEARKWANEGANEAYRKFKVSDAAAPAFDKAEQEKSNNNKPQPKQPESAKGTKPALAPNNPSK